MREVRAVMVSTSSPLHVERLSISDYVLMRSAANLHVSQRAAVVENRYLSQSVDQNSNKKFRSPLLFLLFSSSRARNRWESLRLAQTHFFGRIFPSNYIKLSRIRKLFFSHSAVWTYDRIYVFPDTFTYFQSAATSSK